jgi:hypothetical protein
MLVCSGSGGSVHVFKLGESATPSLLGQLTRVVKGEERHFALAKCGPGVEASVVGVRDGGVLVVQREAEGKIVFYRFLVDRRNGGECSLNTRVELV